MIISSLSNEKIKYIRALKNKKARDESSCFIVEGENILKDMPNDTAVKCFVCDKNLADKFAYITSRFDAELLLVEPKIMTSISDTVTPSGCLAVVHKPSLEMTAFKGTALVLDGISDAGNLGTLIRTAVATGIKDIYLANCCDYTSPKVVRSTMSGIFKARFYECEISTLLDFFASHGVRLLALDMSNTDLFDVNIASDEDIAIIVGSEAQGISSISRERGELVSLPQTDDMESLNASVAGGIAMYVVQKKKKKL